MESEGNILILIVIAVAILIIYFKCKNSQQVEKFKLDNVQQPAKGRYWGGRYYGGWHGTYGYSDFYYMNYPFTYGPNCEKVDKDAYCGPWRPVKVAIDSLYTGVVDEYRCCRKYY
jgi:hypothetical protein